MFLHPRDDWAWDLCKVTGGHGLLKGLVQGVHDCTELWRWQVVQRCQLLLYMYGSLLCNTTHGHIDFLHYTAWWSLMMLWCTYCLCLSPINNNDLMKTHSLSLSFLTPPNLPQWGTDQEILTTWNFTSSEICLLSWPGWLWWADTICS